MKARYLTGALLGLLTAWAALTRSWLAPGLAALAIGQGLLAVFWLRARSGSPAPGALLGFLALSCSGLSYLIAVLVGAPETTRFWIVFGSALAIFAPVVVLAQRLFRESAGAPGQDRLT
jgi:hypothetical protein